MPESLRRRNRLSAEETYVVWGLAAVSAVLGALAGCDPTRTAWFDPILTGVVAGLVCLAGATAPWWAPASAAAVLAVSHMSSWTMWVSIAVCIVMVALGVLHESAGLVRAVSALAIAQVALRLDIDHPFGVSALVGGLAMGVVLVSGISRRSRRVRQLAVRSALGVLGFCLLSMIGALVAGLTARKALSDGVNAATTGLQSMRSGDSQAAAEALERSASALGRARRSVDSPLTWPGRLVPGLGQHVDSAVRLVNAGRDAAQVVSKAVATVDVDSVRVRSGYVDLTAIERLQLPIEVTRDAVGELQRAVERSRSGWLLGPFASRFERLAEETARADLQARNAYEAAQLAPHLLGGDGKRVWLVLFTTPAEARGLGGFIGNFAEVETEGGRIRIVRQGTNVQLINGGDNPAARSISGPAEYLARYGQFGAGGNGKPMTRFFWVKVNMSPDLPTVARVVAEIYPQSGGRTIDGVVVADPYALRSIVSLTGPLTVPGTDTVLTTNNIVRYLLVDQYQRFVSADSTRKDALAEVANQATEALLGTDLPSPVLIARAFGGVLTSGHLMFWSLREEDQGPIRRLEIGGAAPAATSDGAFFTVNNSGPSKLDTFLQQSMTYDAVVDEHTGEVLAELEIRLRNTLPTPSPLPDYLIGNDRGLPLGTNRTLLTVYSPLEIVGVTVNGGPQAFDTVPELGWLSHNSPVDIAPGGETVVRLTLAGRVGLEDGYSWAFRPQPLVDTTQVQVNVRFRHGKRSIRLSGDIDTPVRLTA